MPSVWACRCSGRHNKKFTLIEMLVVISIIAVLAALLMPALDTAIQSARTLHCVNNKKNIGVASQLFVDDNDGRFMGSAYKIGGVNGWVINKTILEWTHLQQLGLALRVTGNTVAKDGDLNCPLAVNLTSTTRNGGFNRYLCGGGTYSSVTDPQKWPKPVNAGAESEAYYRLGARISSVKRPSIVIAYMDWEEAGKSSFYWDSVYRTDLGYLHESSYTGDWLLSNTSRGGAAFRHGKSEASMVCPRLYVDGSAEAVSFDVDDWQRNRIDYTY